MKKFALALLSALRSEKGSSIVDGIIEMSVGAIGLIVVLAFVSPSVMTGTDTATALAQVALPLIMIVLIIVGAFTSVKAATR